MCVCALHDSPGGASRVRTGDPLLAKQVLSQLSYGPVDSTLEPRPGSTVDPFFLRQGAAARGGRQPISAVATQHQEKVVGLGGLEPPASPLSGVRSNHLSYRPGVLLAVAIPVSRNSANHAGHLCGRLATALPCL